MAKCRSICIECHRRGVYCMKRMDEVNRELDREVAKIIRKKSEFYDFVDDFYEDYEPFDEMNITNGMGMTPKQIAEADDKFGAAMKKYGLVFEDGPSIEQRRWRNII